ncbi:hypothetical protein FA13DRAFT_1626649 [Coprinellus micaceus]|uniref:Fungal-type protein kinase domain-containing protein n=1 Tax=Coprinellus micaceus TaxID=71717 RepID=A0A4Y7TI60_COPMI|nr:hypothetical protein FA13DRAFT_1626649 [Coprinellus micaceus]
MDPEFSICSVESFFATYLPFSPSEKDVDAFMVSQRASKKDNCASVNQVPDLPAHGDYLQRHQTAGIPRNVNSLTEEQASVIIENSNGQLLFRSFQTTLTPQHDTDIAIYQQLQEIADAVSNATVSHRSRNELAFRCCPNKPITSDICGSSDQIDACISVGVATEGKLESHHIAVVFEFTLGNAPDIKNNQQAVSASVLIMNDDVRRAFTFGVTIVREQVRLIYHGRAGSVVSEPFSLITDPRLLIGVFMAFLFASKEELGYDPNVTRLHDGQYVFRIPGSAQEDQVGRDQFYRTVRSLSVYWSNYIAGRHSRVWLVDILESPTSTKSRGRAVLKDVWLDEDALTERQIQDRLFRDIYDFWTDPMVEQSPIYKGLSYLGPELKALINGPFESARFRDYFLHIEADWLGRASPKLPKDSSRIKFFLLPTSQESTAGTHRPVRSEVGVANDPTTQHFTPRRQYRVVFKEICTPVDALATLGEVFDTLEQALTPLRLMFSAGWVHRDISAGNIMAEKVGDTLRGKLCDLEYARRFPGDPGIIAVGDAKTGTAYFMPLEILSGIPLSQRFSGAYRSMQLMGHKTPVRRLGILHNFQHDLECFFWVAVWNSTARVDHEPSQEFARKVFRNTMQASAGRSETLCQPVRSAMVKALIGPAQEPLVTFFERFRDTLCQQYSQRRENYTDLNVTDREAYAQTHVYVDQAFAKIGNSQSRGWRSVALLQDQPMKPGLPAQPEQTIEPPARAPITKRPLQTDSEYVPSDNSSSANGGSTSRSRSKARHGRH